MVIIKGGEVLEDTRSVDVMILDKTGTVTEGRMEPTDVIAPRGLMVQPWWLWQPHWRLCQHPIARHGQRSGSSG